MVRLLRSSLTIIGLLLWMMKRVKGCWGETEMMMRVWTTTRRRRKGRKLGISVMRVIMMMMIDHDYVALTLQIEGVCLVFRITALFN